MQRLTMQPRLHRKQCRQSRQRGAVLIVGLVMLTVMTLLVVSMIKTSVIDLKIGGVSQDALVNFNNAEIGLTTYFNSNNGKFSNNCLTLAGALGCNNTVMPASNTLIGNSALGVLPFQVYCGDKPGFTGDQVGVSFQTVVVDVVSASTSTLGNGTRLHAGIQMDLPPGACSTV